MGQENQPKHRQKARDLKRRAAKRAPYKSMLIVCEGEKTEPQYFGEIRQEHRLATANVQVWPSALGTQPLQVVDYAELLFREGDRSKGILPKAFDHVYAVFDRDDHATYHQALAKADSLRDKLKNDSGEVVTFQAIASVPCFELWLLLHFEDIHAPIHRDEVYARLKHICRNTIKAIAVTGRPPNTGSNRQLPELRPVLQSPPPTTAVNPTLACTNLYFRWRT